MFQAFCPKQSLPTGRLCRFGTSGAAVYRACSYSSVKRRSSGSPHKYGEGLAEDWGRHGATSRELADQITLFIMLSRNSEFARSRSAMKLACVYRKPQPVVGEGESRKLIG